MKGKWKVESNFIGGEKMYRPYRLKDVNAVDHSGNREYKGDYMKDRSLVEAIVSQLNDMEAGYAY